MIDNVNVVQAFLPGGSSLVESRRQKGPRTALLAKLFSDLNSNFFLTEQKSLLAWGLLIGKFQIGIQTLF
jgi:lipase chaperone LimK